MRRPMRHVVSTSFSFGTPTKKKNRKGGRNVNEEGADLPRRAVYTCIYFLLFSLSLLPFRVMSEQLRLAGVKIVVV